MHRIHGALFESRVPMMAKILACKLLRLDHTYKAHGLILEQHPTSNATVSDWKWLQNIICPQLEPPKHIVGQSCPQPRMGIPKPRMASKNSTIKQVVCIT